MKLAATQQQCGATLAARTRRPQQPTYSVVAEVVDAHGGLVEVGLQRIISEALPKSTQQVRLRIHKRKNTMRSYASTGPHAPALAARHHP